MEKLQHRLTKLRAGTTSIAPDIKSLEFDD